jgi:hypothetical protein
MNLVVTRLYGGLGNQFFQYAIGRALAARHGAQLKLDVSAYSHLRSRSYELDRYPIAADIASEGVMRMIRSRDGPLLTLADPSRPAPLGRFTRYEEPHFHYDPVVEALAPPVYLMGYWNSERYFGHIADLIRRELTPAEPLDAANHALLQEVGAVPSVSIHIRRGDYANDPDTLRYHGLCPPEYYRRAVEHVAAREGLARFFVFSDDPDWVRAHLRFGHPTTYVDLNPPERGYRDLQLIAGCRHHIIANSTFSWWGAWLNPSPGKIVVAPERWFDQGPGDTQDVVPRSWIRL